jgi:streptogramin lyase
MHMAEKHTVRKIVAATAAVLFFLAPGLARGERTPSPAALSGRVTSQEEGPMEGVLIRARKTGSTITTTVVSDQQGRYSFPRNRLDPGQYSLSIRAAGYETDPVQAEVTSSKTATADLKLRKTQNLASQLTTAEWLISAPGTEEQKNALLNCVGCHTVERIFRSRYNAAQLMDVARRMAGYYEGSLPERPQKKPPQPEAITARISAAQTEYLSSINLSSAAEWRYPLKTLPRPKGKATRVIITEYDLPRKYAMPHDVVPDGEGMIWYSDHGQQYLGRMDPKTGQVTEYSVPVVKPGFATGLHFLQFDPQGNIWLTMGAQAAVAKFDRKTQKFQTWSMPTGRAGVTNPNAYALLLANLTMDGKLWVGEPTGRTIERLDLGSGEWDREALDPYKDIPKNSPAGARRHFFYDIYADSRKNVYLTDNSSEYIDRMDARTGKVVLYPTQKFDSAPRRGHVDKQDRLWFGEYQANRIGMFDPKTERIQEWEIPTPFSGPYDVYPDKYGYAWTGGMTTDRVVRLDPKTGEIVEYLLPRTTNIRRVEVDDSTEPVAFWTGDNHGASIVKLEPLD